MPTIQGVTSIPANGSNNNVLAGSAFEFMPYHGRVDIGLVGDAGGNHRATVQSGSDVLLEESPISRAARVPVWPDDYSLSDVAAAGDRLKLAVRNVSAGALDVFWAVRVTPL
jgi:hypothetical protein